MLIAFDCRIIRDKNPAGISRVVLEFLREVLSADRRNEYILIFENEELKDFVIHFLRNVKKTVKILIIPFGIISFGDVFELPKILESRKVDIYYLPYYMTSPFHRKKYKVIITVFDLMHFFYPNLKMNLIRKIYHRFIIGQKMVFRRVDKIITISINTSRDLVKMFKINTRKIKMIYMGVGKSFRPTNLRISQRMMKEKFNINRKYILYVGRNEPHKNIKGLIVAYNLLSERIKERFCLVIVGKEDPKYIDDVRSLVYKYNLENQVFFTGYVEEDDLPYIYSGASVYVQPSFYEGFGLPIIEAMSCGVPVVCSNTSSLPEVGGDAALYSEPYDVQKMSENITAILEDETYRKEMIERGLRQSKNFSWFAAANNLVECFNELGGRSENENKI